ncbi:unnamed protein product (macronuclear) [Paramecium tetraurelia]|uniref:Protein kinase domain-containing protein n=1 Tax=Paramecium tetraurelia TaxID=5888 RepID=A0C0K4_PARTE|nr:uncharacterized protein GSPATT00006174001 [Paramecium tetraurelia]CAK64321.1 unnamed protein product [Paramecium tetraurelia]|eukprot:XP_001431719.1 hypothetical protein (macronuclear) [Paramecium tetraurelia strain d4-2]
MGNLQTLINYHAPLNYAQDLSEQIIDQGMLEHPGLGSIQLWKIKETNLPLLFSFHVHIFEKDSSIIDIHNFRSSLQHPNLIEYFACTSSKALNIGKVQSQQFFFAYYQKTLKEHIQSTAMTEVQIWKIIEQIVDVMVFLQRKNRYHGNINSQSIFITDNLHIKLLDKIGQNPNRNSIKDDVYDLGILVIELLTKRTNQLNFIQQIKNLYGKFTLQLLQLVAKMIDENPDKRPDFNQIQSMVTNRFKEPISLNNLEKNAYQNKLASRISTQGQLQNDKMKSTQDQSLLRSQYPYLMSQKSVINSTILRCDTNQNLQDSQSNNASPSNLNNQFLTPRKILSGQKPLYSTTAYRGSPQNQRYLDNQITPRNLEFNL